MSLIVFRPQGLLSSTFDLLDADTKLGELSFSMWKEAGSFVLDGEAYAIKRGRAWLDSFVVAHADAASSEVLACAESVGFFKTGFRMVDQGRVLLLKPEGIFSRNFILTIDGVRWGTIRRNGMLGREGTADLPEPLATPLRIFLIWIALLLWRRAESAATDALAST